MAGMKKSYLFIAVAEGIVGMRTFACWCQACMQAVGRGQGSLDSNLRCAECVSPHLPWSERACTRQDAAGLANARKKAQAYARQLASQLERRLSSGRVLVAVQNRGEDDPDQYALAIKSRTSQIFTCYVPSALNLTAINAPRAGTGLAGRRAWSRRTQTRATCRVDACGTTRATSRSR